MTVYLYSIYDKLMNEYALPVCAYNDNVAARDFENACLSPDNPFIKHPTDYTLMLIGKLDTSSGVITGIEPTPIVRATDFAIEE